MTEIKVNRHLADPAMDRIDHALGRPLDPLGETYPDYYEAEPEEAAEMATSPYWRYGDLQYVFGCITTMFRVTAAGRAALAAYLGNKDAS